MAVQYNNSDDESRTRGRNTAASGQAMIELAVALVVVMVLLAGLIQIGHLAGARTRTMIRARDLAGEAAMSAFFIPSGDDDAFFPEPAAADVSDAFREEQDAYAMSTFFLVRGQASETIDTFPVIRSLVYQHPTVRAESRVWMVWTRGIY